MNTSAMAARQYLGTQVQSSSPAERVVLLYDAALRGLATARDAMARRDIPARREAMSKTMAIVTELQNALDFERGGAVATELDRLYTWMVERLTDAVVRQDARPIDEVYPVLDSLADAWRAIARGPVAAEAPR
jgi:flagellar protein FliS